jgi:lysophospholipase L1-like esterase
MVLKRFPIWALISIITNVILLIILVYLWQRQIWQNQTSQSRSAVMQSSVSGDQILATSQDNSEMMITQLGERHYLNYQQWLDLLTLEAQRVAQENPDHLNLLLGDSISLWFPPELLPPDTVWLNQGISGETSRGLLKRLNIVDQTKPQKIFIMIGINDLLQGMKDDSVVANHLLIIRYLRKVHPQSKIIVQSILPHSGKNATWEGKDKLLKIPNERIQKINRRLQKIAEAEKVIFLDLYPLFADENGDLRMEFSTDGLHLASTGYEIWRSTLQVINLVQIN